jgi:hypothetical protein
MLLPKPNLCGSSSKQTAAREHVSSQTQPIGFDFKPNHNLPNPTCAVQIQNKTNELGHGS